MRAPLARTPVLRDLMRTDLVVVGPQVPLGQAHRLLVQTGVRYLPVVDGDDAPPTRRVVLAWRRSFTRYEAIAALRNAVYACELAGVKRLS